MTKSSVRSKPILTMSSRIIGPCVIAIKRQHMLNNEIDDLELSSSNLAKIDEAIAAERRTTCNSVQDSSKQSSPIQVSSDEGDSDSEMDPDNPTINMSPEIQKHSLPIDVTVTPDKERNSASPQPGPSYYEDITCETQIPSTPLSNAEDIDDEEITVVEKIKKEIRDGKALLSQIDYQFLHDIRQTIKIQSQKPLSKLRERRIKISKTVAHLTKQKKQLDNLLVLLNSQKDDIDDSLHKINYFLENFPFQ